MWEELAIPLAFVSVAYSFYLTYKLYKIGDKNDGQCLAWFNFVGFIPFDYSFFD